MSSFEGSWAPPPQSNETPRMTHGDLAGFWRRFVAHLCDGVNTLVVVIPFNILATAVGGDNNGGLISMVGTIAGVYMLARWTGQRGGSPLRVRYGVLVIDEHDGSFIGTKRAVYRILMSYVSQMVLLLGYFWMLWDKDNQTWHDKVAKSVVVRR